MAPYNASNNNINKTIDTGQLPGGNAMSVLHPLETLTASTDTSCVTEIKYTHVPTAQQWLWLLQTTGRRRWIALRVMGFLLIAIGLLDIAWGGQLWLVCLIMAVPVIFLPTIVTRAAVHRITAFPVATSEREVTISDRGVEVVQPLARIWYDLSLLKSIVTGPLGWILFSQGGIVTLVPRSALTSDQIGQMEAFALTFRRSNTAAT